MTKLSLNKSSMLREVARLKSFERFLPSLDLKRKQLISERLKARQSHSRIQSKMDAVQQSVHEDLPMLANYEIDLRGAVKLKQVHFGVENIMGARLPLVESIDLEVARYGYLAKPHWVDVVVRRLSRTLKLRVELEVAKRREILLDEAVRKATQRVNLVEKVLIPRSREHIKKIRVYLSDEERAAVVRSKIAKRKRAAEGLS
ncbi:MAG: V-type ATP synthase subunit D [Gammaproteobacteria bacterium]|nr:V-type ATP synthase subunit D [Gammaproteobacteria bacterium]